MKARTKLQEARHARGWTQADLIDALTAAAERLGVESPTRASLKTLVSMYENGRRPVGRDHRPLFREAYQATDAELGLPSHVEETGPRDPSSVPSPQSKLPAPVSTEMLGYLASVLRQHAQAEPLVGPRFLVAPVRSQMPLIEQMCQESHGLLRADVLRVGARYAEFLGWLYQDTGRTDEAVRWTRTAMDYAQELGDPMLIAYVLQRRGNIATEAGHAGHGAGLATAALRHTTSLSPRVHAVVLRQLANSKARLGERSETARAIEHAMAATDEGDDSDPLAGYCSPAYIEMEGADCALHLDRPDEAVPTFHKSLSHWPALQERDRGLCLARLATANAALEDVEGAYEAARQALDIAERTGSARIRAELSRLRQRLAPWRKLVEISELNAALDRMNGADL